ncbi:MAG TPA: acetyl-CoA hydrolase/transferase C-terminal domain-containing protein [Syntrophorhabdaceae bacterium]|nr:acetyl-CoA hydrolase/transferase family protein [Syntrophorhabdaceae bacterium]MDI9561029.1 acetyl-CoA hydrolase/transferase C-terminal domain-containing protein [Pseudomonadota bacterium]MBP8698864.1 acetyl-CoA hydrolase/transferase family protein [Syntrophorhabdaceae bacterium]HOF56834.1 acetyl-CoA hydrolase/transferase C-terminal domain-containing protein [Syntrophorhabdaceae bacterium]HOG38934.1 acetyl-CoA hydrolase/transferase C-terminal domain-containing protein [Syntrophorhabdaceae ba
MSGYKECICSAEEAVQKVKSGDRIVFSHACGEPRVLPATLMKRVDELTGVQIVHMVPMGEALYCRPEYAGSFRHVALFSGAPTREAIWENRADYVPYVFSEIPFLFDSVLPVDVAMVTVSPPDKNGFCSLGVSVDYTKKAVESAKIVIAEINKAMPRTHGDSFVHVSEIDCFVEVDIPIAELKATELTDVEINIGKYVTELIEDGSCLQLGIGGIPDAVLKNLGSLKDLGVHSEMISDGVKHLVEKGIVNGRKKNFHKDKIVITFLMGSREFYDWVDDNPIIEMRTVDYTNNPYIIAQNKNMVAINSALEVDLLGQVCADTIGPKQFSGVGGQLDFVRGARMSEGGKAVIALPSTAKGGISRIVPTLKEGAAVTTSRNDVDYVVTDYGIASLKGKTVRDRMKALINIAHPNVREELQKKAYEVYRVLI